MAPEVLIVGEASRRGELVARIAGLGYAAAVCTRPVLELRIAMGDCGLSMAGRLRVAPAVEAAKVAAASGWDEID